jgi:hypothetical protein
MLSSEITNKLLVINLNSVKNMNILLMTQNLQLIQEFIGYFCLIR